MELNEKLQELRKQKGLTQEELAAQLFVSRTAVSKWESGRGYPNIESLKAISQFFDVTVDVLLSGEELLILSEADSVRKENRFRDLVFGLLDLSAAAFLFLPFFGQKTGELVRSVSLLALTDIAPYLRTSYFVVVAAMVAVGILTLALQNCEQVLWTRNKNKLSIVCNTLGLLLFVISQQPYAATFLLIFLMIKVFLLMKWQ